MSNSLQAVKQEVFELERAFNERWSAGDNRGYLDSFHEDVSYFDPVLENQLVGRDAVVDHIQKLYQNPQIVRSEYLNPQVVVGDAGDLAVLSYNLRTYVADGDGGEQLLRAWNATHAYRMTLGAWQIVHSNWAITQSMTTASAS